MTVEVRNAVLRLLKEFGKLSEEELREYLKIRFGIKIDRKKLVEILKADGRFKKEKDVWYLP